MTVQLIKDGSPVANTPINNAIVSNTTTLSFSAPAVLNSSLNQQNCILGGSVTGVKCVPTSFGIRLKSARTGCTVDLPNVLVYNPIDTTCRAALTITTPALPAGTATVAYGPLTMAAVGGTGVGFSWSAFGLPAATGDQHRHGRHLRHSGRGGHLHRDGGRHGFGHEHRLTNVFRCR